MSSSGLGKLFGGFRKAKKPPQLPKRDYDEKGTPKDEEIDEDSSETYLEPTQIHSTQLPNKAQMPAYPPPRPQHHSPSGVRKEGDRIVDKVSSSEVPTVNKSSTSPGSTRTQNVVSVRAEHAREIGERQRAQLSSVPGKTTAKALTDDYADPFDAVTAGKTVQSLQRNVKNGSDYCEPWDSTTKLKDDYCDPYDSKRDSGTEDLDYIDPVDSYCHPSHLRDKPKKLTLDNSHDGEDPEDYQEPYDANRVGPCERRTSLPKGLRKSSVRGDQLSDQDSTPPRSPVYKIQSRRSPFATNPTEETTAVTQTPHVDTRPLDDYDTPWKDLMQSPSTQSSSHLEQTPANDHRSQDNYCAPWESNIPMSRTPSTKQGISPKTAKASRRAKQESQTPQVDTRPLDDYDEPWKSVSPGTASIPQRPPKLLQTPAADQRPLDDYDAPWKSLDESLSKASLSTEDHDKTSGGIRPAPKSAGIMPKSQRPADDVRPLDDYDEPWKSVGESRPQERSGYSVKNNTDNYFEPESIFSSVSSPGDSHEFKVPIESQKAPVPPRSHAKLPESNKEITQDETKTVPNPIPKPPRMIVDPSIPLDKQGWYHGSVKRTVAENILQDSEDCSFLVRDSESNSRDYSLSIKTSSCITHLKIQQDDNNCFVLGQFSKPFGDIPSMIHYYTINKLNIKGVEHKTLQNPLQEAPI